MKEKLQELFCLLKLNKISRHFILARNFLIKKKSTGISNVYILIVNCESICKKKEKENTFKEAINKQHFVKVFFFR